MSLTLYKSENAMTDNVTYANATPSSVFLRQALVKDIPKLETLLNRSYRFDEGWTNEKSLVGGVRTNQDELASVISDAKQYLFVYPKTDTGHREGVETGEILGCINVDIQDDSAYIGFFAVNPDLQGSGVGNVMLQAAETFVQSCLTDDQASPSQQAANDKVIKMLVLNGRDKMLAYYQRRDYVCTGHTQSFSENDSEGNPKDKELYFIEIEKVID